MTEKSQSLTEEVKVLFEQAGLDTEASEKLSSLFEASVTAKVNQIKEQVVSDVESLKADMQEQKEQEINEAVEEVRMNLSEQVGFYLDAFAEEWMEKNKVAVEHGIRTEVAENFISSMVGLFKENYVDLPEEKYDLVASLKEQVEKLSTDLNEKVGETITLKATLKEQARVLVFNQVAENLADTEVEKLTALVEGIDYENDDVYRDKLTMIKETYITAGEQRKSYDLDFAEIDEEVVSPLCAEVTSLVESLDRLNRR